jgi:hypothetical protein
MAISFFARAGLIRLNRCNYAMAGMVCKAVVASSRPVAGVIFFCNEIGGKRSFPVLPA